MMVSVPLEDELPESILSVSVSLPCEESARRQMSEIQEECSHQNPVMLRSLILHFWALELQENKFLLFMPSSL